MIPNVKRWKKWTYTTRLKYLGIIIGIIYAVIEGSLTIYDMIKKKEPSIIDNSSTVNNFYNQEVQSKNETIVTYRIRGDINNDIKSILKREYGISFSEGGHSLIELNYSGDLVKDQWSDNLFQYYGGYLTLKLNGEICKEFTDLKINEKRKNSRYDIQTSINQDLRQIISENKTTISKAVVQCIRGN